MKKGFTLSFLMLIIGVQSIYAQCNWSTTYTPTTQTGFDWRVVDNYGQYNMYLSVNNQNTLYPVLSPWTPSDANNNYNIQQFQNQVTKDYQPADGWELIHYNFGTPPPVPVSQLPDYPYLILYNRFTSILRIFFFVQKFSVVNAGSVYITFEDGSKQSAVLSSSVAIKTPLHQFDNNMITALPNEYPVAPTGINDNNWVHADFPMLYDPCGCNNSQTFKIGFNTELNSNISWTTVGTQSTEQSVSDASGNQSVAGEKSAIGYNILSAGTSAIKTGAKYFEDFSTMKDKYEGSKFQEFLTDKKVDDKIAKAFESGVLNKIAKIGEALPVIGSAVSLADAFIGILDGSDVNGGEPAALVPSTYYVNLKTTGTISTKYTNGAKSIKVPGSAPQAKPAYHDPYYNLPLGVMNVIESPTVEYAEYTGGSYTNIVRACGSNGTISPDFTFREYHLKDDIKYIINPYSGLELVDIQASLFFQHNYDLGSFDWYDRDYNSNEDTYGPKSLNPYLYIASDQNQNMRSGLIHTTPFMPLNCLKNNSSVMSFYTGQNPNIWVKVVAMFKKSGSTDGKIYTHINSYNVSNIISANISKSFSISSNSWWTDNIPFCPVYHFKYYVSGVDKRAFGSYNIPASITLANTAINQSSYSAASDIQIQSGNTIPNPNQSIKFFAPDIEITGEFTSGNEMTFGNLDYTDPVFSSCGSTSISPQTSVTFCNDAVYLAQTNPAPSSREEEAIVSNTPKLPYPTSTLSPHPNPLWTSTTFYYKVPEKGSVKLYLTNGLGQKVAEVLSNATHEAGEFEIEYTNSSLPSGMYLVVLEAEGVKETIRLAVVR